MKLNIKYNNHLKTDKMMKKTFYLRKSVLALLASVLLFPFSSSAILIHGDVAYSNSINITDVTALIDNIFMDYVSAVDDVDGDNRVTISDVTALINYLLTGEWRWAYHGPAIPDNAEVFTVAGYTFAMIPVEGGFVNTTGGNGEKYVEDFYIGQTEVPMGLWIALMGSNPSSNSVFYQSPWQPVNHVSWWECQEFIAKLNEITGREFHLPLRDQWRYAAKGGKYSHGYIYAGSNTPEEVAWIQTDPPELYDNTMFQSSIFFVIVGLKAPNELGLYDMSGNVLEWTYNSVQVDTISPLDSEEHRRWQKTMYGGSAYNMYIDCKIDNGQTHYAGEIPMYSGLRLALGGH